MMGSSNPTKQNSQINVGLRKLGIMFTLTCICKQRDSDKNDKTMMKVSQHFTRMKQDLKSSSIAGPLYFDLSQVLSINATALESLITSTSSIFARCNSCRSTSLCSSLLFVVAHQIIPYTLPQYFCVMCVLFVDKRNINQFHFETFLKR